MVSRTAFRSQSTTMAIYRGFESVVYQCLPAISPRAERNSAFALDACFLSSDNQPHSRALYPPPHAHSHARLSSGCKLDADCFENLPKLVTFRGRSF